MSENIVLSDKTKNNIRVNAFYTNKIHTDTEFYEKEKKRVTEYQKNRYASDPEYKEKKKEYCRIKMKELYQKRKALSQSIVV